MDRSRSATAARRAALIGLAACLGWAPPAAAAGESLVSLELCRDVEERAGVGCGAQFPADVGQVHALLAVLVPPGTAGEVVLVWRNGDQVVQRQTLAIRFHRPGGYRTRARQRISTRATGPWSLEVLDAGGRALITRRFSVGDPASAPDASAPTPDAAPPDATAPDAAAPDAEVSALDGAAPAADAAPGDGASPLDAAPDPPSRVAPPDPPPAAPPATAEPADPAAGDEANRQRGALMLLVGGLLLLIAGVVIARRRSKRAPVGPPVTAGRGAPQPTAPQPTAPQPITRPAPDRAASTASAPPAAPPVSLEAATDALQRLTDLVTGLWSRWVAATAGSPQRALNAAWRTVPDPGRLGLDHIRLCNALESAARVYATIPPRGTSADLLKLRLYAQAPALLGVVCALSVECERLGFDGVGLERAFAPWGGRPGLTAELLGILDDGAAALGTTRLAAVPYETKATTASRDFDAELRPFPLPTALADRLAAGNRIVRVETPPFEGAGPLVVWGITST